MGETNGGQLRFVRQETPITPKHLPRFGIEVDEAFLLGGSPSPPVFAPPFKLMSIEGSVA